MLDALQVVKYSLRDLWEEFVLLVVLNIVWSLAILLPLIPLFALRTMDSIWVLAISLLLLLPLPIISGALCFVANQISRGKVTSWGSFFAGVRRYWAKSLIVALINFVALVLIATNLQFYGFALQGTWTNLAVSLWLIVGVCWLLVQVFWFPMILELESEKVFLALRNALTMVIITPGFSLTLALLMAALIALCIVLTIPVMLFMASLLLLICNHASRSRLAFARKEPYKPGIEQD